jgi:small GTP-binding protein
MSMTNTRANSGIKTVLLGESAIGKTSIVTRLIKQQFVADTSATIGASYQVGLGERFENRRFAFWDTAGQERYASIMPMYYRDARLILLIFDMSRLSSIDKIVSYLVKIKNEAREPFATIVIGNKLDLAVKQGDNIEEIDTYVKEQLKEIGKEDFVYVSTKTGENFDILLRKLIDKGTMIEESLKPELEDDTIINIEEPTKKYYSNCFCS